MISIADFYTYGSGHSTADVLKDTHKAEPDNDPAGHSHDGFPARRQNGMTVKNQP